MRTACYARFSSDVQRDTSLDDQIRSCREYAERSQWTWQDDHIYTDAAISGFSIDGRAGLQALLTAAASTPRPFDVLLVDDSSRVARDLADALRVLQRLRFAGVRVIYISQGIDSTSEQAETLVAVHGLVDGLYLREMAAKIKRGLRGQLSRGLATGGITYGYKTVPIPDPNKAGEKLGCRIEVEPTEADYVRRIFEWFADGASMPTIITRLQEQGAPTPRGGGHGDRWRVGSIRRMLTNPKYRGMLVWGRTRIERKPGSRAKVARSVAPSEWSTLERPELRVIDNALWDRVQDRQRRRSEALTTYRQAGRMLLRGTPAAVRTPASLFTGFLRCGVCGHAFSITSRHTVKGVLYRYLGCQFHSKNGKTACTNHVMARVEQSERALLAGLQAELLRGDTVAYVTEQLSKALRAVVDQTPATREALSKQRDAARTKLRNLVAAIEGGTASAAILAAVRDREAEIARLDAELAALEQPIDERRLTVLPTWVRQQLADVANLLYESPDRARNEFERLGVQFTLHPVFDVPVGAKPFLRAVGEGDFMHLVGNGEFPTAGLSLPR